MFDGMTVMQLASLVSGLIFVAVSAGLAWRDPPPTCKPVIPGGQTRPLHRKTKMARFLIFTVFAGVAVSGCTTPEYDAEFGVCEREWMKRMPPKFEQRMVNRVRYEQVPDGNITCYNYGYRMVQCTQGTRTISIPYMEAEIVDIYEVARDEKIESCAETRCVKKFGNAECKTGK